VTGHAELTAGGQRFVHRTRRYVGKLVYVALHIRKPFNVNDDMLGKRTQLCKGAGTEGDGVFLLVMALGYPVEGAAHIRGVWYKDASVQNLLETNNIFVKSD
jgi:hypothetical protein